MISYTYLSLYIFIVKFQPSSFRRNQNGFTIIFSEKKLKKKNLDLPESHFPASHITFVRITADPRKCDLGRCEPVFFDTFKCDTGENSQINLGKPFWAIFQSSSPRYTNSQSLSTKHMAYLQHSWNSVKIYKKKSWIYILHLHGWVFDDIYISKQYFTVKTISERIWARSCRI
jgi:hypothetical protein